MRQQPISDERDDHDARDQRGSPAGRPRKRPDQPGGWVTAGLIGVVLAYALYRTFELPTVIQRWPLALCTLGLILLVIHGIEQVVLVRQWRAVDGATARVRSTPADDAGGPDDAAAKAVPAEVKDTAQYGRAEDYTQRGDIKTIGAFFAFALFALGTYGIGFLPAMLLFLPGYMLANGERHVGKLLGMTALAAVLFFLLFDYVLNASLTAGEWIETDWLTDWVPR